MASYREQKGSIAIFSIALTLACILILLALFELCCIYIAREETKTVSDAIALSAAQEMLFLDYSTIIPIAQKMADDRGCRVSALDVEYDEVEVSVVKEMDVAVLGIIDLAGLRTVSSSSRAKVIYPWDSKLGLCRRHSYGQKQK